MTEASTIITFASWEDRFWEGLHSLIVSSAPSALLMYYFDGYAEKTVENRARVTRLCQDKGIVVIATEMRISDPAHNWACLRSTLMAEERSMAEVVVDLSTMPREIIWLVFWFLDLSRRRIDYVYHLPRGYGAWLSRDPERPRLVYKMSGVARLGRRTALLVLAGYDVDRTQHLVNFYEPAVTLLGLQAQYRDRDNADRMRRHAERFGRNAAVSLFDIDAYAPDHGQAVIEGMIEPYVDSHNIIMSSLGPKLSAVALYRVHREHREIGLVYAPSREFNQGYSTGIGDTMRGTV